MSKSDYYTVKNSKSRHIKDNKECLTEKFRPDFPPFCEDKYMQFIWKSNFLVVEIGTICLNYSM